MKKICMVIGWIVLIPAGILVGAGMALSSVAFWMHGVAGVSEDPHLREGQR